MILLKNGLVYAMTGGAPEVMDILVEGRLIKKVAKDIKAPKGAEVVDCTDRLIMPGFIDAHCHLGLWEDSIGFEGDDGNEMTDPITPHLRGIDAMNPMDVTFKEAREGGVTTAVAGPGSANIIGGQFAAVKTYGDRIDDMIIKAPIAMKCAFGENPKRVYSGTKKTPNTRLAIVGEFRKTLFAAKEYLAKKEAAGEDMTKMPAYDMKLEALIPVLKKEIHLKAHAHRADDIFSAIRIAKEFDVKLSLEHCTEGHLIAEHLAKEGYPAIVGPTFGHRTKVELKNKSFDTPKILHQAGVKIAIMTDSPVIPLQNLPMCAALAAKAGLDEMEALKAISINAAEITGIADRVGSLEVGKDADIVVWDRHPFELQANVCMTLISGEVVYKR